MQAMYLGEKNKKTKVVWFLSVQTLTRKVTINRTRVIQSKHSS